MCVLVWCSYRCMRACLCVCWCVVCAIKNVSSSLRSNIAHRPGIRSDCIVASCLPLVLFPFLFPPDSEWVFPVGAYWTVYAVCALYIFEWNYLNKNKTKIFHCELKHLQWKVLSDHRIILFLILKFAKKLEQRFVSLNKYHTALHYITVPYYYSVYLWI